MSFNNNDIQEHCDRTSLDHEKGGSGDSFTLEELTKIDNKTSEDVLHDISSHEHISLIKTEDEVVTNTLKTNEDIYFHVDTDKKQIDDNCAENINLELNCPVIDTNVTDVKIDNDNRHDNIQCMSDNIAQESVIMNKKESVEEHISKECDGHDYYLPERDVINHEGGDEDISRPMEDIPDCTSSTRESTVIDDTDGLNEKHTIHNITDVKDVLSNDSLPENNADIFIDILGNGLLTKRVISKGMGRETRPTHGDSVTIEYKAWNSLNEQFAERTETFVIGDGDMIQAFDLALCLAEMQEEFVLKTDARFAYGSHGMLPDVQPDETLTYIIKLLSSEDAPDYTTYNYENRMIAADKKRERGNYLYRREEFSYAVNSYSRAIKIIETDPDFKKSYADPSKADMFDLFVKVTNNLAASQLKLESYDSVIETCNTILNYDANNVKALFRKGKALSLKNSYDDAITVLKKAFELDTKNKLIANEIQKCQQSKKHDDEKSARFCRRIFGNDSNKIDGRGCSVLSSCDTVTGWKHLLYKYSPYVGAVLVTGLSIFVATVAINKSKQG